MPSSSFLDAEVQVAEGGKTDLGNPRVGVADPNKGVPTLLVGPAPGLVPDRQHILWARQRLYVILVGFGGGREI